MSPTHHEGVDAGVSKNAGSHSVWEEDAVDSKACAVTHDDRGLLDCRAQHEGVEDDLS